MPQPDNTINAHATITRYLAFIEAHHCKNSHAIEYTTAKRKLLIFDAGDACGTMEPLSQEGLNMGKVSFADRIESTLLAIETALDALGDDVDYDRNGDVLTIELDNGSVVIINGQSATEQLWVAARSGGFHFDWNGERWVDDRDGSALGEKLTEILRQQGGVDVVLPATI
jgi:CyaY protein